MPRFIDLHFIFIGFTNAGRNHKSMRSRVSFCRPHDWNEGKEAVMRNHEAGQMDQVDTQTPGCSILARSKAR